MHDDPELEKLKQVYSCKSWGEDSSFEIRIYLAMERKLTKLEEDYISSAGEAIRRKIVEEDDRNDPYNQERAKAWLEKAPTLFERAGFPAIYVEQIPNEYYRERDWFPWLMVTTAVGHIKIGWRKRVIEINWSRSDVTADADTLFPHEAVTKDGRLIHAWSYDDAVRYLEAIHLAK